MNHKLCEFLEQAGFFKVFRDPIRVPRISENYRVPRISENYRVPRISENYRVPRTRENLVPRIRGIGSLQVHTGAPNIFLKKICNKCIMKIRTNYTFNSNSFSMFSCFSIDLECCKCAR